MVGNFKNGGAEWEPKGSPRQVNDHDFADKQLGKVAPYGIYDVAASTGWVNVGAGHETAAFAVESIRRWWKVELTQLATELGITVVHLPPGASKWNKSSTGCSRRSR